MDSLQAVEFRRIMCSQVCVHREPNSNHALISLYLFCFLFLRQNPCYRYVQYFVLQVCRLLRINHTM